MNLKLVAVSRCIPRALLTNPKPEYSGRKLYSNTILVYATQG